MQMQHNLRVKQEEWMKLTWAQWNNKRGNKTPVTPPHGQPNALTVQKQLLLLRFLRFFSRLRNPGVAESSALLGALSLLAPLRHSFEVCDFISFSIESLSVTKFTWMVNQKRPRSVAILQPLYWPLNGWFFFFLPFLLRVIKHKWSYW